MEPQCPFFLRLLLCGGLLIPPAAAADYAIFPILSTTPVSFTDADDRASVIKAAFIYNFLLFTNWPKEHQQDRILRIGVCGREKKWKGLADLNGKTIRNRRVEVVFLGREAWQAATLTKIHVLFFAESSGSWQNELLADVSGKPVLTIGEKASFLDSGGMIRLFTARNRLRFEVNLATARSAKISFRSRLLRLAARIIKTPPRKGAAL